VSSPGGGTGVSPVSVDGAATTATAVAALGGAIQENAAIAKKRQWNQKSMVRMWPASRSSL